VNELKVDIELNLIRITSGTPAIGLSFTKSQAQQLAVALYDALEHLDNRFDRRVEIENWARVAP